jgi:simple sugar transport system ATP-binding protein
VESLAADGMAVLFISSELDEVLRRSDRVAVYRDRCKIAELSGDAIDEPTVMALMAKVGDHEADA